MKYDVVFEEQLEGCYTVTVPSLPGSVVKETLSRKQKKISDAIKLYLKNLAEDGEKISQKTCS